MAAPKQVKIKQSDLQKLPAAIRNDPKAMAAVNTILTTYTKLEAKYGCDLVLEVAESIPAVVPAVVGPRIVSIKSRGKWDVFIRAEGCDDWPTKTETKSGKSKTTQGKLFIKGEFVDAMRPDQFRGALKELNNAFGVGEHSINAQPGEMVPVVIRSYDGRSTIVFDWKWPFEAT